MKDVQRFLTDYDLKDGDSFSAKISVKSRNIETGRDYNCLAGETSIYTITVSVSDIKPYTFSISPTQETNGPFSISEFSTKNNVFVYIKSSDGVSASDVLTIIGFSEKNIYVYILSDICKK